LKIDKVSSTGLPQRAEQSKTRAADTGNTGVTPSAQSHLSHRLEDSSHDVDLAKVAEIKAAIKEGRLEIDSSKIAEKLLNNVRDMLKGDS